MASDLPSDTNPSVTTAPVAFFGVPSGDAAAGTPALALVTVASVVPTSSPTHQIPTNNLRRIDAPLLIERLPHVPRCQLAGA